MDLNTPYCTSVRARANLVSQLGRANLVSRDIFDAPARRPRLPGRRRCHTQPGYPPDTQPGYPPDTQPGYTPACDA